ncbi:hypothetical protein CEXT_637151 [Caerostris extrusa]|uniref:Uncharacterized protein n=1 Tax=Caerostris extrusa TaxID=172846 RepID=A0AAV4TAV2_CAEEX|nr:hypothetical protein CEXT_637151 [Caerostris extrusa]
MADSGRGLAVNAAGADEKSNQFVPVKSVRRMLHSTEATRSNVEESCFTVSHSSRIRYSCSLMIKDNNSTRERERAQGVLWCVEA